MVHLTVPNMYLRSPVSGEAPAENIGDKERVHLKPETKDLGGSHLPEMSPQALELPLPWRSGH